jgi:tetratricopeptide (TPR) repeat protein
LLAAHAWARWRATGDAAPLGDAIAALEHAGLRESAATLSAQAALAAWYQDNATESEALIGRAKALLEGLPESPALAAVLAESARLAVFSARYGEGEGETAAAEELAARFGLDELRASVLVTRGVLKTIDGELAEASALYESSLELAPPGTPPVLRALANLATLEVLAGNRERWRRRHAAAVDVAQRTGDRANLLWLEQQRVAYLIEFGEWDEALRRVDDAFGGDANYLDRSVQLIRAAIVAARGRLEDARQMRDHALVGIDEIKEEQVAIPTRMGAAWISLLLDEDDDVRRLVSETWPIVRRSRHRAPGVGARETVLAIRAGMAEQWRERHARNADTARVVAARLMLAGAVVESAEAWARISPFDEAVARLEAARVLAEQGRRGEAGVQLQRGLAFFRAVGATRIIQQAEAVLAAAS